MDSCWSLGNHSSIVNSQAAMVHTHPGFPLVAEVNPEVKARLVIKMRKFPIDHQTFVIIDVVKSFATSKSEKRPGLAHIKKVIVVVVYKLGHSSPTTLAAA